MEDHLRDGQTVYIKESALRDYRLNPEYALTHLGQVAELKTPDKFQTSFAWRAVYEDGFRICIDNDEIEAIAVQCPNCEGDAVTRHYGSAFECRMCDGSGYVRDSQEI